MDRYEVRFWRIVSGTRLGRDVVCVNAKSTADAKKAGARRIRALRQPPEWVTFEVIDVRPA